MEEYEDRGRLAFGVEQDPRCHLPIRASSPCQEEKAARPSCLFMAMSQPQGKDTMTAISHSHPKQEQHKRNEHLRCAASPRLQAWRRHRRAAACRPPGARCLWPTEQHPEPAAQKPKCQVARRNEQQGHHSSGKRRQDSGPVGQVVVPHRGGRVHPAVFHAVRPQHPQHPQSSAPPRNHRSPGKGLLQSLAEGHDALIGHGLSKSGVNPQWTGHTR